MFNLFKRKPQPRVVSVRTAPDADPLPANIDTPAFMRRTPEQQRAFDEVQLITLRLLCEKNLDTAATVLAEFGAKRLLDLRPEQYAAYIVKAQEVLPHDRRQHGQKHRNRGILVKQREGF